MRIGYLPARQIANSSFNDDQVAPLQTKGELGQCLWLRWWFRTCRRLGNSVRLGVGATRRGHHEVCQQGSVCYKRIHLPCAFPGLVSKLEKERQ